MLFNSLDFGIFLPVVFILYWFVFNKNLRLQNTLIVVSSYIFYGWWDWRFTSLILFSTVVDYFVGLRLRNEKSTAKRKFLLLTSIIINLGFLGIFKYYNFFAENFVQAFTLLGFSIKKSSLNIILPVGISFYTFQTLSYTIDVYRKKLEPTSDFVAFSAFVSFFPQLVAGPIERASHLLPQFYRERKFSYYESVIGMRQILWGLVKKIVIADNCSDLANFCFNNSADLPGSTLLLGSIFFAFQIFGDFSGYSDIAIGTARLFGFKLMRNFAYPYFSRDISEFWRRWHISLSSWFRDYIYIPLGGSRISMAGKIRNTFIIFLVSGFWHGANWTFIMWGAVNALYFMPLMLSSRNRKYMGIVAEGKLFPTFGEAFSIISTFLLTCLAWIFFRAENLSHAFRYLREIFSPSIIIRPVFKGISNAGLAFVLVVVFIIVEWLGRENSFAIEKLFEEKHPVFRFLIYYILIAVIIWTGGSQQEFIYFQF